MIRLKDDFQKNFLKNKQYKHESFISSISFLIAEADKKQNYTVGDALVKAMVEIIDDVSLDDYSAEEHTDKMDYIMALHFINQCTNLRAEEIDDIAAVLEKAVH